MVRQDQIISSNEEQPGPNPVIPNLTGYFYQRFGKIPGSSGFHMGKFPMINYVPAIKFDKIWV
jgi:hypothetical protein